MPWFPNTENEEDLQVSLIFKIIPRCSFSSLPRPLFLLVNHESRVDENVPPPHPRSGNIRTWRLSFGLKPETGRDVEASRRLEGEFLQTRGWGGL